MMLLKDQILLSNGTLPDEFSKAVLLIDDFSTDIENSL